MAVPSCSFTVFVSLQILILSINFAFGGVLSNHSPSYLSVTGKPSNSSGKTNDKPGEWVDVIGANTSQHGEYDGQADDIDDDEPLAESYERVQHSKPNHSPKHSAETTRDNDDDLVLSQSDTESLSSMTVNASSKSSTVEEKERLLRLKMFKETFLHKLGLKSPPNVTQMELPELPSVVLNRLLTDRAQNDQPLRMEDMRPRKIVVFAEEGEVYCGDDVEEDACFKFEVANAVEHSIVFSARLWVYITYAPEGSSVVVNRPQHHYGNRRVLVSRKLYSQEGWVEIEIPLERHKWNRPQHYFEISTKPLQAGGNRTLSKESGRRPMLMLAMTRNGLSSRTRRSVGQCSTDQTSCCKKDFVADFAEIGWTSWIIRPSTYNVHYCSGSCGVASRHFMTDHSEVIALHIEHDQAESDMALCCVPNDVSGLGVIYYDDDIAIHTATINVVVEDCGCL